MYHLVSLLLALTVLAISSSAQAESSPLQLGAVEFPGPRASLLETSLVERPNDLDLAGATEGQAQTRTEGTPSMPQQLMEDIPAGPGAHEGFFTSISGSLALMMLSGKEGSLSAVGPGMGLNVVAGFGLGRLAPFAEVSYEATVAAGEPSNHRRTFDQPSFTFLAVGTGLALILDEALITASWVFHAKSTGKGVIEGDRALLDATGRGLRLSATSLIRTPFRWGIGLGAYMQVLSLTSVVDDAALTGTSLGLTANFSYF